MAILDNLRDWLSKSDLSTTRLRISRFESVLAFTASLMWLIDPLVDILLLEFTVLTELTVCTEVSLTFLAVSVSDALRVIDEGERV